MKGSWWTEKTLPGMHGYGTDQFVESSRLQTQNLQEGGTKGEGEETAASLAFWEPSLVRGRPQGATRTGGSTQRTRRWCKVEPHPPWPRRDATITKQTTPKGAKARFWKGQPLAHSHRLTKMSTNALKKHLYLISFLSSSSAAWFSPGQIFALNFL